MSHQEEIIIPKLRPEEVKVFLAESNTDRIEAITKSLGRAGLGRSVITAECFERASEFIDRQVPHALTANVFLLDGNFSPGEYRTSWEGNRLTEGLLNKFYEPLRSITDAAVSSLRELGVPDEQLTEVINGDPLRGIARAQLQAEALIAGISRTEAGSLQYAAQLPWANYSDHDIGQVVYKTIIQAQTPQP